MGHAFNSDILIREDDRREAHREFGAIAFALENDALTETFAPIDRRANLSKARSRRWGALSALLASAALMIAAGALIYQDLSTAQLGIVAAAGGVAVVASLVLGLSGLMLRKRKMRWLADRLTTERLRQFHFQAYVAHAADILAGAKDESARERYLKKRADAFVGFSKDHFAHVEERLNRLIGEDRPDDGMIFGTADTAVIDPDDPHLKQYLGAYEKLRFDRQLHYFDRTLREDDGLWRSSPAGLAQIVGALALAAFFCIAAAIALAAMGSVADAGWMKGRTMQLAAIWAAIVAASARIFEEGLQPSREVERMRWHRYSVKQIEQRYDSAKSPAARIAAMRDLEKLCYDEMVEFLRNSSRARFVM